MSDEEMPNAQDVSLDEETKLLRAQQILAGALFTSKEQVNVLSTRKLKSGYYRVTFQDLRPGSEKMFDKSAVLDLTFPLETRPIDQIIREHQAEGRELFLALGAGVRDYPKKENGDPNESKRAFFATDISYGIAPHEDNFAMLNLPMRYSTPASMMEKAWPEPTHFFNTIDDDAIPDDTFDTIQMCNVLSDPKLRTLPFSPLKNALRILKRDTGEFLIMNRLLPLEHSPYHLKLMLSTYGGIIDEVVFHALKAEPKEKQMYKKGMSVVSAEIVARLERDYHVSPEHLVNGLSEGAYCVIVKKSDRPGVKFGDMPSLDVDPYYG